MDNFIFILLISIAAVLFRAAIYLLFIVRGAQKTQDKANDVSYTLQELHDIGNPFNKFNGFRNL